MPSKQIYNTVYQFIYRCFASIIIALLLVSCGATPVKNEPTASPAPVSLMPYDKVSQLPQSLRSHTAIQHAYIAVSRQQYALGESYLLLAELDSNNTNLHQQALTIAINLIAFSAQLDALDAWFEHNAGENSLLVDQFQFHIALRQQRYGDAAALGLALSDTNASSSTNALLWTALQALSLSSLQQLLATQPLGSDGMGWAALAQAYLQNGSSLQTQQQHIKQWQAQWPDHVANRIAAADIVRLNDAANRPLDNAVVALPLSGRLRSAGQAIQAAMIAAHLARPQFAKLEFIDSAKDDAEPLLAKLEERQAGVIIGPIDKDKALALASNISRKTPMIALNSFTPVSANSPSFQLSLNIEDEANYLATASPREFNRALVLTTDNTLANRAVTAFANTWQTLPEHTYIDGPLHDAADFSKDIERYLLLTDSKARQRALENIFVETMESNPRRRQDIDLIFLSANAAQARAINPLLAYHYAGDLPVLAPSIVFDGNPDNVSNHDLSGIIFSDTPWATTQVSPLQTEMSYHIHNGGAPSKNLHALGVDAYFFAARTSLWSAAKTASFNGVSGARLIAADGTTTRIPALARLEKQGVSPLQSIPK